MSNFLEDSDDFLFDPSGIFSVDDLLEDIE